VSNQWKVLGLDEEGFVTLNSLRASVASVGPDAFRVRLGGAPVLVVEESYREKVPDPQSVAFQRTDDPDEELEVTAKFSLNSAATHYQGRVAFLVKRPGNPFASMITVGRARNCDIALSLTTVSKVQAYFLREEDGWKLIDQGSTNGTFLNEERLSAGDRRPVGQGDMIRFGRELIVAFVLPDAFLEQVRFG
jgi:FHA domain